MADPKDQEPGESDEDQDDAWETNPKRKPPESGQRLAALAMLTISRNREESERLERAQVGKILRELRKMRNCAATIRRSIEEVETAYAKADREARPSGWQGFILRLMKTGEHRAIETVLRKRRPNLNDMLSRVDSVSENLSDALNRQFQALATKHSTARPGLMRRIGCYEILCLTEKAISKVEKISVGAVHQAKVRFRRGGGLAKFFKDIEAEENAEIDPSDFDLPPSSCSPK